MVREIIAGLKAEFSNFYEENQILAIVLFGSVAKNENDDNSDIDICIIADKSLNQTDILHNAWQVVGGKYDVWLFLELADYMKFEIIENHKIIICDDEPLLYEFLHPYRKLMEDYKFRLRKAESGI